MSSHTDLDRRNRNDATKKDAAKPTPPQTPEDTSGVPVNNGLTKITANLVPRAVVALNHASGTTGDNRTDVINRALQVYAFISDAIDQGKLIIIEDPQTGDRERVVML